VAARPWAGIYGTDPLHTGMRPVAADLDGDGREEVVSFCDATWVNWILPAVSLNVWHLDTTPVAPLQPWLDFFWNLELDTPVAPTGGYDVHGPIATIDTPSIATAPQFPLSWSVHDEPNGSGVDGCQVHYRDFATMSSYVLLHDYGDPGTSVDFTMGEPGHTYKIAVGTRDKAGNFGDWTFKDIVVPFDQKAATFKGAWSGATSSRMFLGSSRYSSAKGASASLTFSNALALGLVVTRRPSGGYAAVYLNGAPVKNVNLYSATAKYQAYVPLRTFAAATNGVLKIVVKRTKASASRGYRVEIDGFAIRE
jgi:hypothetical protein